MRDKKILIVFQGVKLGLETIGIIKENYRQKRIEILISKIEVEIKKIENRKTIWKTLKSNFVEMYFKRK